MLNRIIHGSDTMSEATVRGIVRDHLPKLVDDVQSLLQESGEGVSTPGMTSSLAELNRRGSTRRLSRVNNLGETQQLANRRD